MINKEILYDVDWQKLRVSLLGGFVTKDGMKRNLNTLNEYINAAKNDQDRFHRLWRVVNLLNAVRMGFSGMKLYDTPQDKLLLTQRAVWAKNYKDMQAGGFKLGQLDWKDTEKHLHKLYKDDPEQFDKIRANLVQRTKQSMKKTGTLNYRNELVKFLGLMNEIQGKKQ